MFTCRDACALMTEEREGTLRGWTRAKYKMHMTVCVWCKRYRRQMDEAVELAREVQKEEPPARLEESALAAFRAAKQK